MYTPRQRQGLFCLLFVLSVFLLHQAGTSAYTLQPQQPTVTVVVDPAPWQDWQPHQIQMPGDQPPVQRWTAAPVSPAAGPGLTDYVEIDTLIVIYPNTGAGHFNAAEVERIKEQVRDTAEFMWRNSHLKLHMDLDFLVIDTFKDATEFQTGDPRCPWLWPGDYDGDGESVEADLLAAGVTRDQYHSINLLWAHNGGTLDLCWGGLARLDGWHWQQLGHTGITTNALFNFAGDIWNPFHHEFQHSIDGFFEMNGNSAYFFADQVQSGFKGRFGEDVDFHAFQMRHWPVRDWFDLTPEWGHYRQTADQDQDSVPDAAPSLRITETSLGSSINESDADHDRFTDLQEAMAGYFYASGPNKADTDGDGMIDGVDFTPVQDVNRFIWWGAPPMDGRPAGWSKITGTVLTNGHFITASLYAAYDADYLYLMAETDRYARVRIHLDTAGDGWWYGRDNYEVILRPTNPSVLDEAHVLDATGATIMWDDDPDYPGGRLLSKADILTNVSPLGSGYRVQAAIPTNAAAGLLPVHGREIGLLVELQDTGGSWGRNAWMFERANLVYLTLRRENIFEPNDSQGTASAIEFDSPLLAAIDDPGDQDYYEFTAEAGTAIEAAVNAEQSGSKLDAKLLLYDEDRTRLAISNDIGNWKDPRIRFTLPEKGRYFLRVIENDHPNAGGADYFYRLSLREGDATEPNDRFATAYPISYDSTLYGTIDPAGDVDFYRFEARAGDEVDIAVYDSGAASLFLPNIDLYDAGRNLLVRDAEGYINYMIAEPGTYYVRVRDQGHPEDGGPDFAYNLNIYSLPLDRHEPNDTLHEAASIAYHQELWAYILPAGDYDFYTFNGRSGDEIIAEVGAAGYPNIQSDLDSLLVLYDAAGAELTRSEDYGDSTDSRIDYMLPADGLYFLRVSEKSHPDLGGFDYKYRLWLDLVDSFEPNDDPAHAAPITLGPRFTGVLTGACEDVDYFAFDGLAGQQILVNLAAYDELVAGVELLGPDGETVLSAAGDDSETDPSYLFFRLPESGRYYLRVTGESMWLDYGCEGVYDLQLTTAVIVSPTSSGTAGALDYAAGDLLLYDEMSGRWDLLFDASDLELPVSIAAHAILENDLMLLVFDEGYSPPSAEAIAAQDVAFFTAFSLGETTEGRVGIGDYGLDGSDVGLDEQSEAIDAVAVDGEQRLIVSTIGPCAVPGVPSCGKEDLILFNPSQLGEESSGTWEMFFDGSDVGLMNSNLRAAWVDRSTGDVYFTVEPATAVGELQINPDDVLRCRGGKRGNDTSCVELSIHWTAGDHGLNNTAVDALNLGYYRQPDDHGRITIFVKTEPYDADVEFTFSGDLGDATCKEGLCLGFYDLAKGTYTVHESLPPGWRLVSISCADRDYETTTDRGARTAVIDLDLGEGIRCTFLNVPNAAPSAVSDSYRVAAGQTLDVAAAEGVLANDLDSTDDALEAALVGDVKHGSLALKPDGSFTYMPAAGFLGSDLFTYRAADGELASDTAEVTIIVHPIRLYLPLTSSP